MARLPQPLLASYWISDVGIGDPLQKVVVPLTDILNYRLADGTPQTKVVFLSAAPFSCTPENFQPPYVSIPDGILQQLTLQKGQTRTAVQQLQDAGIKVLLSLIGNNADVDVRMGWEDIPYTQTGDRFANMVAFAKWVKKELIEKYGLDGIDIDDEYGASETNYQAFMDTVGIVRHIVPGLLSKALWNDDPQFQTPVSDDAPYNAKARLSSLLDLGCTMSYDAPFDGQTGIISDYKSYGMTWDKLCVGVQAGPPETGQYTPIGETSQLARWAVKPQSGAPPVLGTMLFTFTQDIQQWDQWPQNSPQYQFPNAGDHAWQKAIVEGMWGPGNWNVTRG